MDFGEIIQYGMTLLMLTLLQAVLGFDNLLYISIESKRVREDKQSMVRKSGIGMAIVLRIILLVVVVKAIQHFQDAFWTTKNSVFGVEMNIHSLIVLVGGAFIIYTAIKEIGHMLAHHDLTDLEGDQTRTVGSAIFWITTMNLVFSFDSILSAIALASAPDPANPDGPRIITTAGMIVMSLSVIFSGILMIWLSDRVSDFLKKNRLYEVLGLFILFIVGIMLVSEGGHLAHLEFFGYHIEPMAKSTFYFVLAVLVMVDIVQGRYQKKLIAQQAAAQKTA